MYGKYENYDDTSYLLPPPLLPSPKNFNGSTTFVVEKIVRIWSELYYDHPTDTTTTSDRTAAIIGTKPWLPKFTDLLLPIIMGASLTLLVTPQMLLATDTLTCTLVKLTTVAVKMATVGLLGPDALIYPARCQLLLADGAPTVGRGKTFWWVN